MHDRGKCTCPDSMSHATQLCDACENEYQQWLTQQAEDARGEARLMNTEELFGQLIAAGLDLEDAA